VDTPRVGSILSAVLLAGLLAGLAVGLLHYVAIEPVIEQAIALEQRAHPAGDEAPPVVPRDLQRGGLVIGWLLYGLVVGLIFGAGYALVRPRFGTASLMVNALLSALVAYWLVALYPFLKYPANPPGVGEAETIAYRQSLFILFWVLSIGGLLAAGWVYRLLRLRTRGAVAWGLAAATYVVWASVLYAVMPANPDPVTLPGELVATFRALSLSGLTLFWLLLGAAFGFLLERFERPPAWHAR
jgi:predicted cobalt transporter CbtA